MRYNTTVLVKLTYKSHFYRLLLKKLMPNENFNRI